MGVGTRILCEICIFVALHSMKRNCLVCCHVSLANSSVQYIRRGCKTLHQLNPNILLPGYAVIQDTEMCGHTTKKKNNKKT